MSILFITGKKSSILGLERDKGNPRYVKGKLPIEHFNLAARICMISVHVLIGTIADLSKLTLKPVNIVECRMRFLSYSTYVSDAGIMSIVSSAY